MYMGLEWLLAIRYLQSKNGRFLCSTASMLSILGIAIGVATLISVMSVMNGFSDKLLQNILAMNGHLVIHCKNADYHKIITDTSEVSGVLTAIPVIEGQAMIKSEYNVTGVIIRGMEEHDINRKLLQYIVNGNTSALEMDNGIVIGSRLAEVLGVHYGDDVVVISSANFLGIAGSKQYRKKYRVIGIFNVGMQEYDSAFAYVTLATARSLLGYQDDSVGYIEVSLDDANRSSDVANMLWEKTGEYVEDWKVQQAQYFHALELERDAMFFILVLIVVVAAFNIISCISVLVRDKRRAIAVMRTMGLSRIAVIRLFSICGLLIGALGTSIGCFIGIVFALNVERVCEFLQVFGRGAILESIAYCLEGVSAKMMMGDILQVVMLSMGISFLAALPPTVRAAYQNPVDVLKYE